MIRRRRNSSEPACLGSRQSLSCVPPCSARDPLLLPAGIIAEEVVEPLPPALVALSRRLVRWADTDVGAACLPCIASWWSLCCQLWQLCLSTWTGQPPLGWCLHCKTGSQMALYTCWLRWRSVAVLLSQFLSREVSLARSCPYAQVKAVATSTCLAAL